MEKEMMDRRSGVWFEKGAGGVASWDGPRWFGGDAGRKVTKFWMFRFFRHHGGFGTSVMEKIG